MHLQRKVYEGSQGARKTGTTTLRIADVKIDVAKLCAVQEGAYTFLEMI
jgi:hypothetical protein